MDGSRRLDGLGRGAGIGPDGWCPPPLGEPEPLTQTLDGVETVRVRLSTPQRINISRIHQRRSMAMSENTIISADSHVFEPVDLWEKRLDRKFRENGPRFVNDYQGNKGTWFVAEGIAPRAIASIAATGIAKEDLVKFK